MLAFIISLTIGTSTLESLPESTGTIQGTVVNGTHGKQPQEGIEVVLRAGTDGELVSVAETKTDQYGKFVFEQVPLEPTLVYLPGANRDGVHYPGQRLRLDPSHRAAQVTIVVFDAASTPCPLVAMRHEIDVTIDEQVLKITESLLISNPSRATYVGESIGNGPPVTFWLSIPENFDRVTFDKEFYGRRFFIVDHRPITEMPWLPGERELKFVYRVPLVESGGQIRRTMDVPSSDVRIRVHGADRRPVSCNLPRSSEGQLAFASAGKQLAREFTIELQIEALPFPWMHYARWSAVAAFAVLAVGTVAIPHLRRGVSNWRQGHSRQQLPKRQRAA